MAEISDKLNIRLLIGNSPHHFNIQRSQEKLFRDAANLINDKYNKYRANFPNQVPEQYNALVMVALATQIVQLQEKNDTAPFVNSMELLTKEIEDVLESTK